MCNTRMYNTQFKTQQYEEPGPIWGIDRHQIFFITAIGYTDCKIEPDCGIVKIWSCVHLN